MASPLQVINSRRRPVVMFAPGRGAVRVAPQQNRRPIPPRLAVSPRTGQRGQPPGPSPWEGFAERVLSTKAAQQAQQEQQPEEERGGFWGSDFGRGLGFVINNPVTRAVSMPINYIQTGGRLATYGLEQGMEALEGGPDWLKDLVAQVPVGQGLMNTIDTERTEADDRSFYEKVLKPNSTYGFGELLPAPKDPSRSLAFLAGLTGLAGDVGLDPLTWITPAGVVAKGAKATELSRARAALAALDEAANADDIARATARLTDAEQAIARGGPDFEFQMPAPRNKAERASFMGEMRLDPARGPLLEQFEQQFRRGGVRGFQEMAPEARRAIGLSDPGLRVRGFDAPIPGTAAIARQINRGGGELRAAIARLPGAEGRARNVRTPKGLTPSYNTLVRGRGGDFQLAAGDVGSRDIIRIGAGEFKARGNRILSQWYKENFKGKSAIEKKAMTVAGEATDELEPVNDLYKQILDAYQSVTGKVIDRRYLRPAEQYIPHRLNDKFRRVLASALKNKDTKKAAKDFMEHADFYKDDLLEGSGHLEKSRKLTPNTLEDGTIEPKVIKIGDHEVTISDGSIDGLNNNESLRAAFPGYEGKFFDDDPIEIARSYILSLSRQAGRDKAERALVKSGMPQVRVMEGALEQTRQAINEAEALRGRGALLSTVDQPYVPGEPVPPVPEVPVVPGGQVDRARRTAIEAAQVEARSANAPEEAAALAAEAATMPAPAERFGDIVPEEFFRTMEGTAATKARKATAKGPAATYAREALKDVNAVEAEIRDSLDTITEPMVEGLRGSIDEQEKLIGQINTRVANMGKRIRAFGKIKTENVGEVEAMINEVETALGRVRADLKRKSSTWKGRATRAQKKVEQNLRESLAKLEKQRDQLRQMVEEAPPKMRAELIERTETLNAPVNEALDDLLLAELAVPVPHNQAALLDAQQTISQVLGDVGSEELLTRFRQIRIDVRNKTSAILAHQPQDTAKLIKLRDDYRQVLEEIDEIGRRPKTNKGQLSKANRLLMDEAVARHKALTSELRAGIAGGKRKAGISPYERALIDIRDRTRQIDAAVERGEDVTKLTAQRDRLQAKLAPGGEFAEEVRARQILDDMEQYEAKVLKDTAPQREALARAEELRRQRQESIIWANETKTLRHFGERTGWGPGEMRRPEPISTGRQQEPAPTPESFWIEAKPYSITDIKTGEKLPAVRTVSQRRETEALESLQNVAEAAERKGAAAGKSLEKLEKRVGRRQTTLPRDITEGQAKAATEIAVEADKELGPLAADVKTYTKLVEDLTDKKSLLEKRRQSKVLRNKLNRVRQRGVRQDLSKTIDDIEAVAKQNTLLDDVELAKVESILNTHRESLMRTDDTKFRAQELNQARKDAYDGKLGTVMIATLHDNWRQLRKGPLEAGDVIMDAELHKRFTNLYELNKEPRVLGRLFNAFTNLWKTYATLSLGFHVRNAIGGIFMNTADGVPLLTQIEGVRLWRRYVKGGEAWLREQPPRVQDAFRAATGSGAGGRFEDVGVLAQTGIKAYNVAASNRVTRGLQRAGTRVEGSMRLGMALHSMDRGESVASALGRLSRVHFDYAQVSELDEQIRRIIPFWTFMSRNLPLQIQQQWTNPRLYSYYNNMVNNFSLPDEEFTPDYWTRAGAWRTPIEAGGNPIYAQPDLGFTRVEQDIKLLGGALGGGGAGQALANVNPGITAMYDFLTGQDSFYGRQYTSKDYTKRGGLIGTPLSIIGKPLGQTNEAGQLSDNFYNLVTSLVPPISQAERVFPGTVGDQRGAAGTWAKRGRYLGVPIQVLTPEAQMSEYRRQYFDMLDEQDRIQAMLEEAAR